jgi:basic membrane protein A
VYTDSFADVQLAAEAAQSFIDNGHAVLTGTAQMTVGAIGVARESSVPWFGTQSNQTTVGPEIVVANQVYRWDVVLDDLVRDIQAGTYGGNSYEINFANGGLVIEYNDAYDLPADVRAAGDAAVANFTAGGAAGEEVLDAEPLRAAVVTPSAENDLAFSQSIVDALHRMEAAGLLSEVAITPGTFIVEDAGVALRNYAEEGYDLVIAHGSQYGGLLEEIAPSFPGTAFAWGTSVETFGQANISAYTTRSDQGGYAMGLAAAVIAGGSPVGIVGPIEVGDAKLFVDGFTAGVEAGGGTANAVYTDSFADVQLAAEAAQSFIDNGHAVLTGTAQMTVGAIGVARESSVPWFGTQSNQTTVGPEIVVANQVYRWDVVLDDLVRDIQAGTYGGNSYEINFANGGLVIEYNDAYDLPADVRAIADAAVASFMGAEPLRAAVVTPSAENDLAFSQSIVDALHRMEQAGLLSEVAVTPGTFVVEDAGVALRRYAEDGYDLVIAHGSQYGSLLEEIAPDFPGTAFAWGTSVDTFGQPNISAYTTSSDEGAYVMGLMAARLAGGSPVGIVGPIKVGDAELYVDGFRAGVEAGGGTANSVYIESFADVALAKETALSFIDDGVAVLTGTAQMTVGAIAAANDHGIPWFGTQSNQTEVGPEVVVANQVYKWDVVLDDLVRDIQRDQMGGGSYKISFANGGLVIEYNDGYDLPADARSAIEDAVAGFKDGSLSTGVG